MFLHLQFARWTGEDVALKRCVCIIKVVSITLLILKLCVVWVPLMDHGADDDCASTIKLYLLRDYISRQWSSSKRFLIKVWWFTVTISPLRHFLFIRDSFKNRIVIISHLKAISASFLMKKVKSLMTLFIKWTMRVGFKELLALIHPFHGGGLQDWASHITPILRPLGYLAIRVTCKLTVRWNGIECSRFKIIETCRDVWVRAWMRVCVDAGTRSALDIMPGVNLSLVLVWRGERVKLPVVHSLGNRSIHYTKEGVINT